MNNKWKLTDEERQILSYHPTLKYVTDIITSTEHIPVSVTSSEVSAMVNNVATDTWSEIQNFLDNISDMITTIESKYMDGTLPTAKDAAVPLSDAEKSYLDSLKYVGYVDFSNGISFKIYKDMIDNGMEPLRSAVMDIYESYHMDVHGVNNVEVYRDLREIYDEWTDIQGFFNKGVLAQINKALPTDLSIGSNGLSELSTQESAELKAYVSAREQLEGMQKRITQSITGKSNENISSLENSYDTLKNIVDTLYDKITVRAEATNATNLKLDAARQVVDKIRVVTQLTIDDSFPTNATDGVNELCSLLDTEDTLSIVASLKMAMGSHIEKLKAIDKKRRSFINRDIKNSINQDLMYGCHLRSSLLQPLSRKLTSINIDTPNADYFLDKVADGIVSSSRKYDEQLSSYYNIEQTDCDLRVERLNEVIDKHFTRTYYRVALAINKFVVDTGKIPTANDADSISKNI